VQAITDYLRVLAALAMPAVITGVGLAVGIGFVLFFKSGEARIAKGLLIQAFRSRSGSARFEIAVLGAILTVGVRLGLQPIRPAVQLLRYAYSHDSKVRSRAAQWCRQIVVNPRIRDEHGSRTAALQALAENEFRAEAKDACSSAATVCDDLIAQLSDPEVSDGDYQTTVELLRSAQTDG